MSTNMHVSEDLGAYALGALDPDEYGSIDEHLSTCGACRTDLAAIEESLSHLPASLEIEQPSHALRAKVFTAAGVELGAEPVRLSIVPPAHVSQAETPVREPTQIASRRRASTWWTAAAGIAAAIILIGSAVLVHSRMNSHTNLSAAQRYNNLVKTAKSRGDTVTSLTSKGAAVSIQAAVAVSSEGTASLILGPSTPAPKGKVYELWWLNSVNDAVKASVYTADRNTASEKSLDSGPRALKLTAVTIEPGPMGSEHPTTKPVALSTISRA